MFVFSIFFFIWKEISQTFHFTILCMLPTYGFPLSHLKFDTDLNRFDFVNYPINTFIFQVFKFNFILVDNISKITIPHFLVTFLN